MSTTMRATGLLRAILLPVGLLLLSGTLLKAADAADGSPKRASAQQILEATGVRGGLVVHVGCGDGRLVAELGANESYTVHGLDRDADNVDSARKHIPRSGSTGGSRPTG